MNISRKRLRIVSALLLAGFIIPTIAAAAPSVPGGSLSTAPNREHIEKLTAVLDNLNKNYSSLEKSIGNPGPEDILDYQVGDLWKKGVDGSGTTIAVIEGWDDPGINDAVKAFDQKYGLPDPDIQTIYPSGSLPAQCPPGMVALGSYGSCDGWKDELRLDVLAAHLMAPYAKILISATPADSEISDDPASQVAPPEMMQALEYIAKNHLADVISISDGTGEATYSYGKEEIRAQDPGLLSAAAAGIPVLIATGDCGIVQNLATASSQCGNVSATPDTSVWSDSPWATAVGGSIPSFDDSGKRVGSDKLWQNEGAGYSSVYERPDYQDRVKSITASEMRSVPDITTDSQAGTSQSAPLFAGILALATQLNHGLLGPVNKALYEDLGPRGEQAGIVDVTSGDNSFISGGTVKVPGFTATMGFDVASGWGTIDASRFVPELVEAVHDQGGEDSPSRQAAQELTKLQQGIQLSRSDDSTYLLAKGFLPQHPVHVDIDGREIATLTASSLGAVTYMINPKPLKLSPGRHTLTLKSMLLDMRASFRDQNSPKSVT